MGSEEKDDEFSFRSISFKMPMEQPGGEAQKAVETRVLEPEKESRAGARASGIAGSQMGVEVRKRLAGYMASTEWR